MKPNRNSNPFLRATSRGLTAAAALSLTVTSARAATWYWDTDAAANVQPGSGAWGTDSFFTQNGTTLAAAPGAGNIVVLAGSGATASSTVNTNAGTDGADGGWVVTTSTAQSQNQLFVNNTGYTLKNNGTSFPSLTLSTSSAGSTTDTSSALYVVAGKTFNIGNGTTGSPDTTVLKLNAGDGNLTSNVFVGAGSTLNLTTGSTAIRDNTTGNGGIRFVGNGTVNINGTLSLTSTTGNNGASAINFGWRDADSITANVKSGALVTAKTTGGNEGNGSIWINQGTQGTGSGNTTLNIESGGSVTAAGTGAFGLVRNAGPTATLNLAGTITAPKVISANSTSTFNFEGGTLKANAANATFMTLTGTTVLVNQPSRIDNGGFDIGIAQPIGGASNLTFQGSGATTLSGASDYAGTTTVSAGVLRIAGSLTNSSVTVDSGATIGGTGTIGGSLTLPAGSAISVEPNGPALAVVNGVNVTGSTNVTFNGTPVNGQTYDIINYSAGLLTGFGNLTSTYRLALVNNTGIGFVQGTVTTGIRTWNTTNGTWQIGGVATPWQEDDQKFFNGDDVLFFNPASPGTVTLTGALSPATVTIENNANAYTFSGTGSITGLTGLTKNGSGILNLATANTYTGATAVNAGTLNLTGGLASTAITVAPGATLSESATGVISGAASLDASDVVTLLGANTYTGATIIRSGVTLTLGNGTAGNDGSIAGTSSVANEGTLVYNRFGSTSTASYAISGTGSVIKNGPGVQALGGASTYSGGTTVNAGTLSIAANNNFGANTSPVSLNGATIRTTAGITNTHPVTIGASGGTFNVTTTGQYFFNTTETLLGTGPLAVTGNGILTVNVGNLRVAQTNSYAGPITLSNGGSFEYGIVGAVAAGSTFTIGNEGEIAVQNAVTMPNAVTVTGGTNSVLSFENGTTGTFSGPVTLNANAIIGLRDWFNYGTVRSGIISGQITGSGSLTVSSGTGNGGLLTLSNASNTYAGGTTVNASKVLANTSGALSTGAVAISGTNAQLQLADTVNIANAITINAGAGTAGQGIIWVPGAAANATLSSPVAINAAAATGGHFASGGGTLAVTGIITSSVPISIRNGIVTFTNAGSSYTGLNINQGTFKLGAANVIPVASTVDLGVNGAATLDLAGFNQTLVGITKNTSGATVTNSGASDSTLTTTGTSIFGGVIQDGPTRKTAVTVNGTLSLTGVNTYTGTTTVNSGGALGLNGSALADTGALVINSSGTVNVTGTEVVNTLTIDGIGMAAGTYGAFGSGATNIDSVHFTGIGILSVTTSGTSSAYDAWAASKGLTGSNNGPAQDPEFDGVSNELEFVLGGNPLASDPSKLPVLTTDATNFIFTFSRDDASEAEIGLIFQYGSTLAGWTDVPVVAGSSSTPPATVNVTENTTSPDTVQVLVPKASAVGGKLFGRLKAVK